MARMYATNVASGAAPAGEAPADAGEAPKVEEMD